MPDQPPAAKAATPATPGTHQEHEDDPWTINIGDHAQRTDSPGYVRSRTLMNKLVKLCQPWFLGGPPYQDHHGGGIWVKTGDTWLLVLNMAGIEWSSQFCADPAKVDQLRQLAKSIVSGFPDTVAGYTALGYADGQTILDTPITNADQIAAWTDSIFNASVPLPAPAHTGVIPKGSGYHHYPKPIVDIAMFKHDDFNLFVSDENGQPVAVAPVSARGSGDSRVRVLFATPGSTLDQAHQKAHDAGEALIVGGDHPLAQQAFANQGPGTTATN
jgi:hypothetical protein